MWISSNLTSHIPIHYMIYTDIWLARSIQQQVALRSKSGRLAYAAEIFEKIIKNSQLHALWCSLFEFLTRKAIPLLEWYCVEDDVLL